MKRFAIGIVTVAAVGLLLAGSQASARGALQGPIIYVVSQELFYDSILTAMELPPNGPFQQLYHCDFGLCTESGPGDPGHHGGRWWIDENDNGEMDDEDAYFSCPLLGPGREAP